MRRLPAAHARHDRAAALLACELFEAPLRYRHMPVMRQGHDHVKAKFVMHPQVVPRAAEERCLRLHVIADVPMQAALDASHQAAEEVLLHAEARHAGALGNVSAARDAALQRVAATEAEFRQALQARRCCDQASAIRPL